ncbi:hypothetical protein SAMN02910292_02859 [Lachnospiraceae bacterium XBB2008]|nr:hypothetical protein SAMN02910292_02859 [Lachnospiraceae bacterium XBB2008]
MDEEIKDRRCKTCGKKLIDEKLPICLRCRLKGRNFMGNLTEAGAGIVLLIAGGKALADQNERDNDV